MRFALRTARSRSHAGRPVRPGAVPRRFLPLATTSANTSGLKSPSSFAEVEARIIEEADIAVDGGPTLRGQASTVVLCTGEHPHVIREGCISSERIWDVL